MTLSRIISGGQTGADQGALLAARSLGIETGGHVPLGWRTETGPAPWLRQYGLVEATTTDYPRRTHINIANSDATLIFGDVNSVGSALTLKTCERLRKKVCVISWRHFWDRRTEPHLPEIDEFVRWLDGVEVLNVAGNRESRHPGIQQAVLQFLTIAIPALWLRENDS